MFHLGTELYISRLSFRSHELIGVVSFGVGCNSTYKGQ